MEPEVFQQHSVVADLKAVVARPAKGACFAQGSWSTLDYFLINPRFEGPLSRSRWAITRARPRTGLWSCGSGGAG
eukprot:11181711-Lingulodinium_polyedra.AAC.1